MTTKELSIRLPEPLFRGLSQQAEETGSTLEEIVVYALTRQTTPVYEVNENSERDLREQQRRHAALMKNLSKNGAPISVERAKKILSERVSTNPEAGLRHETIQKLNDVC